MKACPTCGHVMKSSYRYCARCGQDQEQLSLLPSNEMHSSDHLDDDLDSIPIAPSLSVVSGPAPPRPPRPTDVAPLPPPRAKPGRVGRLRYSNGQQDASTSRGIDPVAGHFGGDGIGEQNAASQKRRIESAHTAATPAGSRPILPLSPLFDESVRNGEQPLPGRIAGESEPKFGQYLNVGLVGAVVILCAAGLFAAARSNSHHGLGAQANLTPQPTSLIAPAQTPANPNTLDTRPRVQLTREGAANSAQQPPPATMTTATVSDPAIPLLRRDSERYYVEDGSSNVVGQVTNISAAPLTHLDAVTTFYDRYNGVVKIAKAPLPIATIAPGYSSPYHVAVKASHGIVSETTRIVVHGGAQVACVAAPRRFPAAPPLSRPARLHELRLAKHLQRLKAIQTAHALRAAKLAQIAAIRRERHDQRLAAMRKTTMVKTASYAHAPKPPAPPSRSIYKAPPISPRVVALRKSATHTLQLRQQQQAEQRQHAKAIAAARMARTISYHHTPPAATAKPFAQAAASRPQSVLRPKLITSVRTTSNAPAAKPDTDNWYPGYSD